MKKLIIPIMALAAIVASFASMQNLVNKSNNTYTGYQLQVVINNNTSNVDGSNDNVWFYFDNFIVNSYAPTVNFKNNPNVILPGGDLGLDQYNDVFATHLGTSVTIFNWYLDYALSFNLTFNFGTLYDLADVCGVWYHAQLVSVTNYLCSFVHQTGKNGLRIVINAGGGTGANNANWGLDYYKF